MRDTWLGFDRTGLTSAFRQVTRLVFRPSSSGDKRGLLHQKIFSAVTTVVLGDSDLLTAWEVITLCVRMSAAMIVSHGGQMILLCHGFLQRYVARELNIAGLS